MKKNCLIIIVLLLFVIVGGGYKFLVQGSVSKSADGRIAIHLSVGERDLVLSEMRAFLVSVQQINKNIAENNMQLVAENARKVGRAAQGKVPGTLVGKLPIRFKKLGFDTHTKFDQLALDADELGDSNQALSALSSLMQNCISCHATYRFYISNE